jgi:spore coat polysaccharide biosynthesis protein SpsF (cytidylyltransferase family)
MTIRNEKICAIIAVRLLSKRLPNKALLDLEGYSVIERVVFNLKGSKYIDQIILATSTSPEDDAIVELAKEKNIDCYRGDGDNVVQRFIDAGGYYDADLVVRVTGDNPLTSYEILDLLIETYFNEGGDYYSIDFSKAPPGTYGDVFKFSALKKLGESSLDLNLSEYMTYYFINNPEHFSIKILPCPEIYKRPNYRLTLDYPEDLTLLKEIYQNLGDNKHSISLCDVIDLLDNNKHLVRINSGLEVKYKDNNKLVEKLNEVTKM